MDAKKVRKPVGKALKIIIGAIILVILGWAGVLGYGKYAAAGTDIGSCAAPDGYTYVFKQPATDLNGNQIFIARAVVATGDASAGGKEITMPPCGSSDPALTNVAKMFIKIDGKLAFIVNGAIGASTNPLAPSPQP